MRQRPKPRPLRLAAALLALAATVGCSDRREEKPAPEPGTTAPTAPPLAPPPAAASPNAAESAPSGDATAELDRSPLGVFKGTLPCDDCEGIQTELALYLEPDVFTLKETYVGGPSAGRTVSSEGKWATQEGNAADPDATLVQLNPDKPDLARSFLEVGGDRLELLDRSQNRNGSPQGRTLVRSPDDEEGR
jgi:uncharacterized lipoprotein NlpE involved in copper resistance